ncbi:MAG: hypothetical protein LBD77_06610 [Bifidobacteriaceae bacterium]|jgi:hypothetical protein|nr:hypothetical protein [Bifidobacteriaceae bacterium]
MTAAAVLMLIVALAVVPGGLVAATAFLALRPEVASYPPPDPGLPD